MEYIQGVDDKSDCFICDAYNDTENDEERLVLWRTRHCMVIFNRFPYNNGHMLICPNRHIEELSEASDEELLEFMQVTRDCKAVLTEAISPHGFNVGINFGRCAGAGLPGHMHIHIVPRWNGDTNFMAVCGQTDVISQSLKQLYRMLKQKSKELNLPSV